MGKVGDLKTFQELYEHDVPYVNRVRHSAPQVPAQTRSLRMTISSDDEDRFHEDREVAAQIL